MSRTISPALQPETARVSLARAVSRWASSRNLLLLYAILPLAVFGALTWFFPVGYGVVMSLTDWNPMSVHPSTFVGLENYRRAFSTPVVWIAILNSAKYALVTVGVGTPLALVLALWLNGLRRGRATLRLIFFLPVVTSMIATAIMWKYLYQPRLGVFNGLLVTVRDALGLTFGLPRYLLDPRLALICIAAMAIWKNLGFTIVIFMAGLSGIPAEYYEAARIDGAGPGALLRHITLPLLRQTTVFVLVTGIAGAMQAFSEIYVMTGSSGGSGGATMGGPVNSTLTIVVELYQRAFRAFEFGYASALAVIIAVIIGLLSLIQLRLGRADWEY